MVLREARRGYGKIYPRRRPRIERARNLHPLLPISLIVMSLTFTSWLSGSFEILFPRECAVCTRPLRGRSLCYRCAPPQENVTGPRCDACFEPIALHEAARGSLCPACITFPPLPKRLRYLWEYSERARDLIRAMKYQPSIYLTRFCGERMREGAASLFGECSWDLIVPIPSSPTMLRRRLFHPCYEMAKIIARQSSSMKIEAALSHNKRRNPQAGLSHTARLKGLDSLFRVRKPSQLRGRRVLLVEDVITTGATIAAATHALHQAGAGEVDVLALAQARVWRRLRARVYRALSD